MNLNKDSNIAVHFSVVRCYELNCSFYGTDSSNYSGKLSVIRIFHTYQKNTSSSLSLIYRIKNNLKLLQQFFLFIVNHASKACQHHSPYQTRHQLSRLVQLFLVFSAGRMQILIRLTIYKEGKLITATSFRDNQLAETRVR